MSNGNPPKVSARVTSGLQVGAIITVAAILGGWAWMLAALAFYAIAYRELMGLMHAKGIYPSRVAVNLASGLFYLLAFMSWERHFQVVITTGVIFTFGWLLLRKHIATISDIGGTILMFFYLGFLPAHFILLRQLGSDQVSPFWLQPGLHYVFFILFTVSASDIFAYYGGKRFGKKLLSPQISPKKTIEGALTGTVGAAVVGLVSALVFGIPAYHGLILGIILAIAAQVGDLSESLLKRDAGIKDSGSLIPGHGGVLDRTDSYIFSGAVAYYYILWFILHQGLFREVMEYLPQ